MEFKTRVFERLLFPLHADAYKGIQRELDLVEKAHPGVLAEVMAMFELEFDSETGKLGVVNGPDRGYPSVDIRVVYDPSVDRRIGLLHKDRDLRVLPAEVSRNSGSDTTGSDVIVGFMKSGHIESYIVPLCFLLGYAEQKVMREGAYQMYVHNILPKEAEKTIRRESSASNQSVNRSNKELAAESLYTYIGITKRSWQRRFLEHNKAAMTGSHLRFHRALRGDLFEVGGYEHIILKAGLDEAQAMRLEEADVESQSLYPIRERGLNMIPGGKAGLRYLSSWSQKMGVALTVKPNPDQFEATLVELQKTQIESLSRTEKADYRNPKLAELWATDMDYRIRAMTNQANRFSYKQIRVARILHASGWSKEKILEKILQLDSKSIGMNQLEGLLDGKTYSGIRDVMF